MTSSRPPRLAPRKQPRQARSAATLEAVFEACIQVLRAEGLERLTTTRVAERAGVSVGSLYQYYPNKEALLAAVLARHLEEVARAVERTCQAHHGSTLQMLVDAVVTAFVSAKMARPEVSQALYAPAAELGGMAVVSALTHRVQHVAAAALASVSDVRLAHPEVCASMLLHAAVGPMQAVLEAGPTPARVAELHAQLVALGLAYLRSQATP